MSIFDLKSFPEHIPSLAQWHHLEWAYLNPGGSLEQRIEKMRLYLNADFIPSTFIYQDNNELMGSAAIIENDMDTHPELSPWLASVYVDKVFRSQGIGTALVHHVMQQAKLNGIEILYLFTPKSEAFYELLGWSTLSKETYRSEQVSLMSVSLV